MKIQLILFLFFGVGALVGCGGSWQADYSKVELVSVSGKVTLDGQPLAKVKVIFESADKASSIGETDEQGNYEARFDSIKTGVTPGPKVVRIRQGGGEDSEEAPGESPDGTVAKTKDSIPACYGAKSQLKVTIEGSSQTVNFDLKSDCSVKGPTT